MAATSRRACCSARRSSGVRTSETHEGSGAQARCISRAPDERSTTATEPVPPGDATSPAAAVSITQGSLRRLLAIGFAAKESSDVDGSHDHSVARALVSSEVVQTRKRSQQMLSFHAMEGSARPRLAPDPSPRSNVHDRRAACG